MKVNKMETKYDIIVDFFLDNWFFAVLILLSVLIMAIPQLKDGVISLYKIAKSILVRKKTEEIYEIKYGEETVILHRWLVSKQFDVVKIDAVSHDLGIHSEYDWIKKYYPKFDSPMQSLRFIVTAQGEKVFDVIHITSEHRNKDIYFDITDFYYGPILNNGDKNKYIEKKISKLYEKDRKD